MSVRVKEEELEALWDALHVVAGRLQASDKILLNGCIEKVEQMMFKASLGALDGRGTPTEDTADATISTHCLCDADANDKTLVKCVDCGEKFHPSCLGKSDFAEWVIKDRTPWVKQQDARKFRHVPFVCLACEEEKEEQEATERP